MSAQSILSTGIASILATGLFFGSGISATAQTGTWTSASGGGWATPANWSGGVIPDGIGATADFSTVELNGPATIDLRGTRTLETLHLGDTFGEAYIFSSVGTGGRLILNGSDGTAAINITSSGSGANVFNVPLLLQSETEVSTTSFLVQSFNGAISGPGKLRVDANGAHPAGTASRVGRIKLAGLNTFTGGVSIEEGASVEAGTALAYGTGPVSVNEGGQSLLGIAGVYRNDFVLRGLGWDETTHRQLGALRSDFNSTIAGSLVLASEHVRIAGNNGQSATLLRGEISEGVAGANLEFGRWDPDAASGIAASASGTFILSNRATHTGSTLISSGTLQIGNGGTSGELSSSAGIVFGHSNTNAEAGSTATLAFNRSDNVVFTLPAVEAVNDAGNRVVGNLHHLGTGNVTWGGTGSGYTGMTTVDGRGGTLTFGTGEVFAFAGAGPISLRNGADLEFNTSSSVTLNQAITGYPHSYLIQSGSGTLTLGGESNNTSLRLMVNDGTVVLAKTSRDQVHAVDVFGVNPGVILSGGVLRLAGSGGNQIHDGAVVQIDSGTIDLNGTNEALGVLHGIGGIVTNSAPNLSTLRLNGSGVQTNGKHHSFGGIIQDGAGVVALQVWGGTQILDGHSTYSGKTLIVNSGLIVNGSLSSTGELEAAGQSKLGGTGSLGHVILGSSSTMQPGADPQDGNAGTLSMQSLTSWGGDFRMDIGTTSDRVNVAGAAAFNSETKIIPVFSAVPVAGSYPLITAGSLTLTQPFVLTGTSGGRFSMTLDRFSEPNTLKLNISGSNKALTWTGASSNEWNFETANWTDGVATEKFFEFDTVVFDDTAATRNVSVYSTRNVGSVTVNNSVGNDYVFEGGPIAGPAGIHKTGGGTLTLKNSNSFTGPLVIDGGKVIVGYFGSLGRPESQITVNAGGSLELSGYELPVGKTIRIAGTGTSGEGALNNSSRGTAPIFGDLELTDDATIGGIYSLDLGSRDHPAVVTGNGHVLTKITTGSLQITGAAEGLSSLGGFVINEGAVFLEGASDILGDAPATINAGGSLMAVYDPLYAHTQRNPVVLNGGTLQSAQGDLQWTGLITITDGASRLHAATNPYTIPGSISDGGNGFTKSGNGMLSLTGDNQVTGPVLVREGTLGIGNGSSSGAITPSAFKVSGVLQYSLLGAAALPSDVTLEFQNSTFRQRGPTQQSTLTIAEAITGTPGNGIFSVESGIAAVADGGKIEVASIRIGSSPFPPAAELDDYPSGPNTGNIGTLNVESGAQVSARELWIGLPTKVGIISNGAETGIVNQTGGSVNVTGPDVTTFKDGPLVIGYSAAAGSQYNLSGGTLNVLNGSVQVGTSGTASSLNISGGIANLRQLKLDGRTATAPYGGALTLSGGELRIGVGGIQAANDGTGLTLVDISGGKLSAAAASTWAAGMNFENTLAELNTGTLTVTATGALVGPGGFTKTGNGTLVLANLESNVDSINIAAGRLLVTGAVSGSITVEGGTLSGAGRTGPVTLEEGGTLAPGNSVGRLDVGDISFAGGTLALAVNGPNEGTLYDQVRVTGGVELTGVTPITLALGYNPIDHAHSFIIISNDGLEPIGGNGVFSYNGAPLPEGGTFTVNSQLFQISYAGGTDSNDVVLSAIPEPATLSLLLGPLSGVLGMRRFRRPRLAAA